MIKRFCDCCGNEILKANEVSADDNALQRLESNYHDTLFLEIRTGTNKNGNIVFDTGDFCKHCIIDAVKSLDDRVPVSAEFATSGPCGPDTTREALQSLQKPKGEA